jgi:hypothetical protein
VVTLDPTDMTRSTRRELLPQYNLQALDTSNPGPGKMFVSQAATSSRAKRGTFSASIVARMEGPSLRSG